MSLAKAVESMLNTIHDIQAPPPKPKPNKKDFIYVCMSCGKLNNYWKYECKSCNERNTTQTDEMQQGDYEV